VEKEISDQLWIEMTGWTGKMLDGMEERLKVKLGPKEREGVLNRVSGIIYGLWIKELKGELCDIFDRKKREIGRENID